MTFVPNTFKLLADPDGDYGGYKSILGFPKKIEGNIATNKERERERERERESVLVYSLYRCFKALIERKLRSPCMREIGVRFPVARDLSRKNR